MTTQSPIKDPDREHPIATVWRPVICEIVKALAEGDWSLTRNIPSVVRPSAKLADHMKEYVAGYSDEPLIELPDETWKSSVARWTAGHWDVLVDLWIRDSGRSDMVLDMRVTESDGGYSFAIHLLYVP